MVSPLFGQSLGFEAVLHPWIIGVALYLALVKRLGGILLL